MLTLTRRFLQVVQGTEAVPGALGGTDAEEPLRTLLEAMVACQVQYVIAE